MNRRSIIFVILFIILTGLLSPSVYAAKKFIRKSRTPATLSLTYSTAKLSRSTNSIIVYFQNLGNVAKISYELNYLAMGKDEGAMGVISPQGANDSRDLYFGTCSKGVCSPHQNITNATLTIHTKLKSGATNVKLYRIKI
jgi:hypothetical protein